MRNLDYLKEFYDGYDEEGRLTSQHGQIEFITTIEYIHKYLKPGMKILEIGAGTGRYSHALAAKGYEVDAVELIQSNIDVFKEKTVPGEKITIRQGDALDLSSFNDEAYDIVLLLGPMYHLYTDGDKALALSEALRVLKSEGLLFTAYCGADASLVCYGFQGGNINSLIENKLVDPETFIASSTPKELFELSRKEDIYKLMEGFSVKRLHYVATDLFTNYMRDAVDKMDMKTFEIYIKYHLSICERSDMVGITHHILDIVRKN